MKRTKRVFATFLTLALALSLALTACGGNGVNPITPPDTTPAQTTTVAPDTTTEAPATAKPKNGPEEAQATIDEFLNMEGIYTKAEGTWKWKDGRTFYMLHLYSHPSGNRIFSLNREGYLVDCATGEPYVKYPADEQLLPLRNLRSISTGEDIDTRMNYAKTPFPGRECMNVQSVRRDGREYHIFGMATTPASEKLEYYYYDILTQELFLWNTDTDTLTPYSPT